VLENFVDFFFDWSQVLHKVGKGANRNVGSLTPCRTRPAARRLLVGLKTKLQTFENMLNRIRDKHKLTIRMDIYPLSELVQ